MRERRVITSLVLSLALHAGGLGTLAIVGTHDGADGGTVSQLGLPGGFELALNSPAMQPLRADVPPPPPSPLPEPIKAELVKPPELIPPDPEEPEVPLGIEESVAPNKVWKGSKEETENLAPKSQVDQAARSMDPTVGSKGERVETTPTAESAPSQPSAASSPTPPAPPAPPTPPQAEPAEVQEGEAPQEQREPLQVRPVQEQPKQDKEQQLEAQQLKEQQLRPQQLERPAPGTPEVRPANVEMELAKPQPKPLQVEPVQPLPVQNKIEQTLLQQLEEQQLKNLQTEAAKEGTSESSTSDAPKPVQQTQPPRPLQPASPASVANPAGSGKATMRDPDPGKKADEESAAAAIVGSLVYKPGEPLAGKGLRVSTVRPKYAFSTMAVANPRDVIINVTFGKDGRVIRAVFKDGRGTGFEDVDKPLVEAVYRWTAKGEALNKIPAGKPHMGVTFEIKFLWGLDTE